MADADVKRRCRILRGIIQQPEMKNVALKQLIDQAEASFGVLFGTYQEQDVMNRAAAIYFGRNAPKASATAASKRPSESSGPPAARQRINAASPQSNVWLVIHDKEPIDSGSDYRYSDGLPSKQDTNIFSAHSTYEGAARAAARYVLDNDLLRCNDEGVTEEDMENDEFVLAHDWEGDGIYRPERESCGPGDADDRVYVLKMVLKP